MGQLRLALLGTPEIHHQSSSHSPSLLSFATRKTLALLVYLAVEEKQQPRDHLTTLLWPDSNSELGRTSLRKTLAYLRQALGEEATHEGEAHILASRDSLRFNPASAVSVDVWQLRAAAEAARQPHLTQSGLRSTLSSSHLRQLLTPLQQAAHAYRGDFLTGFSLNDAPDFDDWASMQRELLHHQVALVFDRLSQLQFETGDLPNGIDSAARWVAQDGLNEAAYRRLMQLQMAGGNRGAALQCYQACCAMLEREFDAEPEAETEELAARIRQERVRQRPQGARPSRSNESTPMPLLHGQAASVAPPEHEVPLIGRTFEHIQLVNAYRAVESAAVSDAVPGGAPGAASAGSQQGRVQVMTLEGEPGIGKTRLADEFLRWAGVQGAQILRGRGLEAHGRLPYQPVVEALRMALPILQPHLSAEAEGRSSQLTQLWLAELSRLLPELSVTFPELPAPRQADEAEVRLHLFEAVARIASELAEAGVLLLFIDDWQWADAASQEVLHYCIRRWSAQKTPILLLLTLRAEELATNSALAEWLNRVRRDAPLTRLTLGALTAEDTLGIVRAMAGVVDNTLAPGMAAQMSFGEAFKGPINMALFSERLFAETQGQPFFIVQTVHSLLEHGLLDPHADPQKRFEAMQKLPTSVRELILARLAQLGSDAQVCCGAAAVLGNRFDFDHLCHLSGLSQAAALSALEEMLARGLWRELEVEEISAPLLYGFSHDRIRDVAYGQLSEARRRLLHRHALEVLAESAPPAELARHAALAAQPERAFLLNIEAGDAAGKLFAVHDAINFYLQALQLWQGGGQWQYRDPEVRATSVDRLFHLYQQLGRAYEVSNQSQQATDTMSALLVLARQESDQAMEVVALNRLATLATHLHADVDNALTLLQQARAVAEAAGDKRGLAETEWNLALQHFYQGRGQMALPHAEAALALARELGERELLARTLNVLAYINAGPAHWAEVVAYGSEAYAIFLALNDRPMALDSLCCVARGNFGLGRPQIGLAAARSAMALIEDVDNPWGKSNALFHLSVGSLETGDYAAALASAQEALEVINKHNLVTIRVLLQLLEGNILRALGRLGEAWQSHQQASEANQALSSHPFDGPVAMALCVDALRIGQLEEAKRWGEEWLQTREASLDSNAELEFAEWVEVMLDGGELALVEEEIARFGERFGHNARYRITHLRAQATLAEWRGERDVALACWQAAYALAGELGIVFEVRRIAGKLR